VSHHPGVITVVIIAFAALIYTGSKGRAPDKGTQVALTPTESTYLGVRNRDDRPEGTIEATGPNGDSWGLSLYGGGVPYQERGQVTGKPGWTYKYTVHRYPIDIDDDFGAWAGFRVAYDGSDAGSGGSSGETGGSGSGFDIGLRYSPVRFAYGVIAPDLLVSTRQAGIGVSCYPPSQTVSYKWQKFGLGIAYMAGYDGGSGWVPYASLSTRF
jgi:hypothetical protein